MHAIAFLSGGIRAKRREFTALQLLTQGYRFRAKLATPPVGIVAPPQNPDRCHPGPDGTPDPGWLVEEALR
jgi:hypothetical protein